MGGVIGASTGWWIGLVLGIVVIAVAALIVITIANELLPQTTRVQPKLPG